ncbi:MAG: hypothetical protein V9G15_11465 [Dermatophilaceae bacterium]
MATALALVFLAATLGGTAREAQGYVPGTFPPSAGTAATVTVDVSHTPTSPEPKPGDTYQYKATFTLANMAEVGTTNEVVLTINADGNAPWTAVPTAANFTSTPAYPAPTTLSCTTTTCTVTYANIKTDGVITFTQNAKVASPLPNGTPIRRHGHRPRSTPRSSVSSWNRSARPISRDSALGRTPSCKRSERPARGWST